MAFNYEPALRELEFELEHLVASLSQADLESEAELEAIALSCPGPMRATVSSFPRYAETIASLPSQEQQKVRQIAAAISRSYRPGCTPVLQVDLVGHADRDYQRGTTFEQRISTRRALELQRALQQLIGNPAILSRIAWQARGVGARKLIVPDPKSEFERARNRRVDVVLSNRISALFPILVKRPGIGYGWTVAAAVPGRASREAEYQLLTFPEPRGVIDSRQVPYKWICSLIVDFGPEVLPGPIVTGRRIGARATGTLISNRHVLTAGHALLTQGPPTKNIFGESKGSTSEALSVTVIPGRDGGKAPAVEPAGRRQAIKTRVSPAWKQSNATNRAFDYGLITLDQPVSSDYGFWSSGQSRIVPLSDPALKGKVAHCSGYPGELCPPPDPTTTVRCDQAKQDDPLKGTVQYQMSGNVSSVSAELLETEMHILEGHSGSPTWLLASNGAMNMVGIASASRGQVPEVAVRIRSAILDNLRAWISQDGVRPAF